MESNGSIESSIHKAAPPEPTLIEPQKKDLEQQPAPAKQKQPEPDTHPNIVVAIPSMRRWTKEWQPAPEHYLYNLVTGIWNQMNAQEKQHVSFLLMNVDKDPDQHQELLRLSAHPAEKIITKAKHSDAAIEGKAKLEDGREVSAESFKWVTGETRDAPMLLLEASKLAPFVVFLEDDVTPTSNVMGKIFKTLEEMKWEGKSDFFMLDLYTPAISWGPQWAGNKEKYSFECCTQAMLFNSQKVASLVDYETMHPSEPVDDNIRDFSRQNPNFGIYAMVPNPFEHVGRFSSNPEKSTGTTEHRSLNFVP
jgi:hypothetical protein